MLDLDALIQQHRAEKTDSVRFKERRTEQWNENYFLYRDKVSTNRLTQRQPVNIPIIRETIQSWMSKIDEEPQLNFEARGRAKQDKRGELFVNEMWKLTFDQQKLDLKDNLDKKIVGLQGRSFKYWSYRQGQVHCDVIDPYDIDIDPRVNPFDLNTATYFNHKNIYIPLRRILANPSYRAEGKNELKTYLDTKQGLIKSNESDEEYQMKIARLRDLGAHNYDDYRATDVMVELTRSYKLIWDKKEEKFVRYLIVYALDKVVLYAQPIEKALGIDFLPCTTWASDPDLNDIWSDGVADSTRTINKVVNMYFSQDLENRTYRNFGMYFFNNLNGTFQPQAFDAKPFGMYGVPGDPREVIQQMKIEPLQDTTAAIDYLKNLIQSSVAQTPSERGEQLKSRTTLGEVQLNLQASKGRNEVVSKQYRNSWEESGRIWYELMKNNVYGSLRLTKKARNGDVYGKDISPSDWKSPAGYEAKVVMKSEREADNDVEFRKLQFVKTSYAQNPVAMKLARRKELEILGWAPDEIDEVMQAESQAPQQLGPDGKPIEATGPEVPSPEEVPVSETSPQTV